jgi:hypothetical protein
MAVYLRYNTHECNCRRPSGAPGTAHFFTSDATSTYIIQRDGLTVRALYHGRNEVPNTAAPKVTDKVRNALVAAGAAFVFLMAPLLSWLLILTCIPIAASRSRKKLNKK